MPLQMLLGPLRCSDSIVHAIKLPPTIQTGHWSAGKGQLEAHPAARWRRAAAHLVRLRRRHETQTLPNFPACSAPSPAALCAPRAACGLPPRAACGRCPLARRWSRCGSGRPDRRIERVGASWAAASEALVRLTGRCAPFAGPAPRRGRAAAAIGADCGRPQRAAGWWRARGGLGRGRGPGPCGEVSRGSG